MSWWQTLRATVFGVRQKAPPWVPPRVYVLQEVIEATATLLTSYRDPATQHEGIAYWAGVSAGDIWIVTTAIAPHAQTTRGSYRTSAVANAQVIAAVANRHLQVLAQVHGHPGDWVGHSDGDNHGAFMPYIGFYSIVVPRYGLQGLLPLASCGIHRFEQGQFVQLSAMEIDQVFTVIPTSIDLRKV
jgi:hypothetical protein